jgi:hypothetical protein
MKTPRRARAARKQKNAGNHQAMRDALMASLSREAKKGKRTTRLQAVADKLVDLALEGDFYAVKDIFDRVDGSPGR